jgi:tetratricopeptide (TPR) repeat protein
MSLNKSKSLRTAEKYVLQGKLPAAIDEYRKVVEADPNDLTTINTLGDLYVRTGRIQDAIRNFSRIADSYREGGFTLKAIAMLKKISKLDPTNVETAMKLANLYSQQGLLVEARQQYLQVADAFARSGQAHKALEAYQKIADLDPSNTSVRMKLGEIYSREGMRDQAHDAFVMAGSELLRKNEFDQALTANLKAIAINPDSRHALTSIASIYTQQGQAERAINLLCEAFERSPGDVELLTILGRTYLSAGWMDDAERTFLSLVELDRARYHYLLEVGRKFLQMENLDRAAEMIDGCLDILIAKREEDKAIDFLRRILDQDLDHLGALKRLAQIFLRIREDHNLIATLNSMVEAATKKGDSEAAISALKELARLEPDESQHFDRLKKLGVGDISFVDAPSVVPATGMLDHNSAVYDEAFVIRQISEAEILAGHGKVDDAVSSLKEILSQAPENTQLRLKLKDIYLRAGRLKQAAEECLELARIHDARGEDARASDYRAEARNLNPLLEETKSSAVSSAREDLSQPDDSFGFDMDFNNDPVFKGESAARLNGNFDEPAPANGFDFDMYQSSSQEHSFADLNDDASFAGNGFAVEEKSSDASFRYFDTINTETGAQQKAQNVADEFLLTSTGDLPTDTMPRAMRDELEGVDFYIAQGYVEIARDSLDRMRAEHGEHSEITLRYKKLGMTTAALKKAQGQTGEADLVQSNGHNVTDSQEINLNLNEAFGFEEPQATNESGFEIPVQQPGDVSFDLDSVPKDGGHRNFMPLMVQKESGKLEQDLVVQFNTSELLNNTEFQAMKPMSGMLTPPAFMKSKAQQNGDTSSGLLDEVLKGFDESGKLGAIVPEPQPLIEPPPPVEVVHTKEAAFVESEPMVSEGDVLELLDEPAFSFRKPAPESFELPEPVVEQPVIEPVVQKIAVEPPVVEPVIQAPVIEQPVFEQKVQKETFDVKDLLDFDDEGDETELQKMLHELKEDSSGISELQDFETHYNLGLAYKDMDLHDDAIGQFQMAYRLASKDGVNEHHVQCCHMLGFCFKNKSMPKVAVMWFQRGLKIPNSTEDEYQALRYEIGSCYEEMGELDKAIDVFTEVYGVDVNYRRVGDKIRELQAAKNA